MSPSKSLTFPSRSLEGGMDFASFKHSTCHDRSVSKVSSCPPAPGDATGVLHGDVKATEGARDLVEGAAEGGRPPAETLEGCGRSW